MKRVHTVLSAVSIAVMSATALAAQAAALAPGDMVDNFRLLDHAGQSHQLYYLSDKKAVVLIAQGNNCAANTKTLPGDQEASRRSMAQQVEFLMINSNLTDKRDQIAAAATEAGYRPADSDGRDAVDRRVARSAQQRRSTRVNPKGWKLAYRGDAQGYGGGSRCGCWATRQ